MKLLGLTEERTDCDCCGKIGLKCTVAFETESGIVYYGRTCATRHYGRSSSQINKELKSIESEKLRAARTEFRNTEEKIAYDKRLKMALEQRINPGLEFLQFCKNERELADLKKAEIESKYGIRLGVA